MQELKVWTKEEIVNLLETNDKMVERSLVKLLEKQTEQEQRTEETIELNGVGFNGSDAPFLTSLANKLKNPEAQFVRRNGDRRNNLTPKQIASARKALKKYAGQLTRIANHEI